MSGAQPQRPILEADRKQPGLNPYLLGCALVSALGGVLFGFDTAVISGTTEVLRNKFVLSDNLLGFTVASTILGSIGAGHPANAIGRRGAIWPSGISVYSLN